MHPLSTTELARAVQAERDAAIRHAIRHPRLDATLREPSPPTARPGRPPRVRWQLRLLFNR